jgi:hypothetical protein
VRKTGGSAEFGADFALDLLQMTAEDIGWHGIDLLQNGDGRPGGTILVQSDAEKKIPSAFTCHNKGLYIVIRIIDRINSVETQR